MILDTGHERQQWSWPKLTLSYLLATATVTMLTGLIYQFQLYDSVANVSMLYLLVVAVSALFLGKGQAIWASLTSFLFFNWFFVNPKYTFTVYDPAEWVALCMFLLTATVIGQLMAMLKAGEQQAIQHQRETAALGEASWAVASQLNSESALTEVAKQIARVAQLEVVAVFAIGEMVPEAVALYSTELTESEQTLDELTSNWLMEVSQADWGSDSYLERTRLKHKSKSLVFLPVLVSDSLLGGIYIKLKPNRTISREERKIVDSLVSHAGIILQRSKLMKAESRAQVLLDADRLKTALLSMVSHDFRSPLTSIKASVSTLLTEGEPLDSETLRGLYQAIDQEADRLNRMVGNILDLSRLEAQAWQPKIEQMSVSELVGMVLDAFSDDANRRISLNLEPALTEVWVDSVQMTQVLKNLVENALKYSDDQSRVEISTRVEGDTAVIEVSDRGRGLQDSEVEQIFEPFYRTPELQESSVPGVGIGLAVCRGLVQAHGGKITASGRKEGGAIFQVRLPELSVVRNVGNVSL